MGIIDVIRREPALITGVATAAFNVLILFDIVNWSEPQIAGVNILAGAVMALVRQIVTPVAE